MNKFTGEIKKFLEGDLIPDEYIPIDLAQATQKQKDEMQVSLKDHTSILGKQLTKNRYRKLKRQNKLS